MTLSDIVARRALSVFNRTGSISVHTPAGETWSIGSGDPSAAIEVADTDVFGRIARSGALGFAESYIDGSMRTADLQALLLWGATNHAVWSDGRAGAIVTPLRRIWQRLAPDRRHESVQTMVDHYNVGNEFYAAWLDPTMTYSSARFVGPVENLESAQREKYRAIAERAGLRSGMRVLEIGCGWGGFAMYAASEFDVMVVGLTVSREQAVFARKQIAEAGLSDRIDIRIEDFRSHDDVYDAVVSIEMIESVDESVWPALFAAFRDRIRSGGRAVLQAITIDDDLFEGYRLRQDFIQRYIFPGGQVPAPGVIGRLADEAGLAVASIETFGLDYARTLNVWMERFRAAWPALSEERFDERFRRMWEFYLAYCEAGFRTGATDVGQWSFVRP